ncbi:MAG: EAL domain-containing protein [Campylobacterales bacterium]|nr:EAL domain-containing protein [Campylobacterales bacterium]
MFSDTVSSPFIRNLWQTISVLITLIITFALYVYAEKQIDRAHEIRLHSFFIADELRQSSDDLTRMVRTYAATGNPIYKKHYQEILDIRNGKQPRPVDYQNIYWDLVGLDDKRPRPSSEQLIPLIEMMRQAGFTKNEFAKLSEAKNNSDELTRIEYAAMELIESSNLNRDQAIDLLHNTVYHQAKASIMHPISEFYRLMNKRTTVAVENAVAMALVLRTLFVLIGLLLLFMFWRLHKTLNATLGASIDTVHTHITRIGRGNFIDPILVDATMKNSILGWLSETQTRLKELLENNERLKNLYAALSQCNQAIVRSVDEAELFPIICRDAVIFGGMKMAWIGKLNEEKNYIKPVAFYGEGTDYLQDLIIPSDPNDPAGKGPTGVAFHTDSPYWCQDFTNDPTSAPWHERGREFGWGGSASLPLHCGGKVVGIFNLYALDVNAFDDAAKKLLEEMAIDISYALDSYATETARTEAERHVYYLANFDNLTGLPNRAHLDEYLKDMLSLAKRNSENITLMFIDLDHFKDINDSLGHSIGDTLLIEAASRFQLQLREEDIVARLGGDEFIVLLPNTSMSGAEQVAQKLLDIFKNPFQIDGYDLSVSASIGIALYPEDGNDFETLFRNADSAMYRAKEEGRNGYCFFTAQMQELSLRNLEMNNALRHALERQEFQLHYQPQISTVDGRIIGVEALLRWNNSELGNVSPAEFIPIAEESGMILSIGEWVLKTAIQQAKTWLEQGEEPIIMAVNLSAVQFRHLSLPTMVSTMLEEVGLPPEYLELELTEGVAMVDPKKAITIMNDLHQRGVRMSIDDFGTGYSSLSYLKKFKIYKLKIDQSFVRDISIDDEDKAIVGAIISMAKSLGLQTIAEGVETIGQLEYLREQGCDEIQGYYFSKPLPLKEFEAFRNNF